MSAHIPFTQYLLPHGRRERVSIEVTDAVGHMADAIIAAGYIFECEMLTDMRTISFTIHDPVDGEDVAIKLALNGPAVPEAVNDLVTGFHGRMKR